MYARTGKERTRIKGELNKKKTPPPNGSVIIIEDSSYLQGSFERKLRKKAP